MTRKHYKAIAGIIAKWYIDKPSKDEEPVQEAISDIVGQLADYFASNKKFNRDIFMKKCFGGE